MPKSAPYVRLSDAEIADLLVPYLGETATLALCEKVCRYLKLLNHWNSRLNLTSLRDPAEIVQRHFGESFFFARMIPAFSHMLDLGSGAGFPGLPVSLWYPKREVMLAEAQSKKAVFLREATWMIGSRAKVWAGRAEDMDEQYFDLVALRAVDDMSHALEVAMNRLAAGGTLAFFAGQYQMRLPEADWLAVESYAIPLSTGHIVVARLADVPRGTDELKTDEAGLTAPNVPRETFQDAVPRFFPYDPLLLLQTTA